MDNGTLPVASSPKDMDGAEASSQRIPGPGKNPEAVREAPEGKASAVGHMGEQTPMDTNNGGRIQFGHHPNIILETHTAPESGEQPSSKEGGVPIPPVTSVQPKAPDTLLEALRGASIVEEHRTLMGTEIERIQSTKSGLTEACTSLLTGFEVSNVTVKILSEYRQ